MHWDRFDICLAFYVYALLHHGGQNSPEYAVFGRLHRLRFRPSPLVNGPEDLSDNARAVYDALVEGELEVRR